MLDVGAVGAVDAKAVGWVMGRAVATAAWEDALTLAG